LYPLTVTLAFHLPPNRKNARQPMSEPPYSHTGQKRGYCRLHGGVAVVDITFVPTSTVAVPHTVSVDPLPV